MKITCRSNFHPSSFNRVFLDISNMAHMATSAALPCCIHQSEYHKIEVFGYAQPNMLMIYKERGAGIINI